MNMNMSILGLIFGAVIYMLFFVISMLVLYLVIKKAVIDAIKKLKNDNIL